MQDNRPPYNAARDMLIVVQPPDAPLALKCDVCLETTAAVATICLAGGFEIEMCGECVRTASNKLNRAAVG